MNAYIKINKLFELLPEPERDLKAVQVYFDEYKTDKFNKNYVDAHILCLSLVHKDNTQKMLYSKEFSECPKLPKCEWLIIPKFAFNNIKTTNNKLMKVYIKSERVNYETSYYHNCIVKICLDQTKLKELVKNRLDVLNAFNKRTENEINDDDIDPDIF